MCKGTKKLLNGLLVLSVMPFAVGCESEKGKDYQKPNILFCLADDVSFSHVGAAGCSWVKTPAFDRVAKEGIIFTNAYTPNAKCAPSRASILTGRNSWQLEEAANHFCNFPAKFKTYAEALGEYGYFVGAVGKKWAPGNPGVINGKKRQLCGPGFDKVKLKPLTTGISSVDYAGNFEMFLEKKPAGEPFVFWYGCNEPHRGYEYGSSISKGGLSPDMVDEVPAFWPDNDSVRTDMMDYAFELNHFDNHLGMMLDALEKRGMLENTLVVVTADNGMPFPRVKGQEYEYSNHLPLAIMWKNGIVNAGRRVDDFVSFIDFAPTFLEVAGLKQIKSGMEGTTGTSLTDIFFNGNSGQVTDYRNSVLIGKERHDIGRPNDWGYPIRGIVKGGYLYLRNFKVERWPSGNPETGYPNADASPTKTEVLKTLFQPDQKHYWDMNFGKRPDEEMFNVVDDPYCINNLVNAESLLSVKNSLVEEMMRRLKEEGDPRVLGNGDFFEQIVYTGADRGYYERVMAGEDIWASWLNKDDRNYIPLE